MEKLSLHNLQVKKGSRRTSKRRGRGNASGRGSYSGRGIKGQKARSGGKAGLKRKGLSQLLKNKPKIGGFRSLKPKMTAVSLELLEAHFDNGAVISPKMMVAKKLVATPQMHIKIIGNSLNKKISVAAHGFSESAQKAILEKGGTAMKIRVGKKLKKKLKHA